MFPCFSSGVIFGSFPSQNLSWYFLLNMTIFLIEVVSMSPFKLHVSLGSGLCFHGQVRKGSQSRGLDARHQLLQNYFWSGKLRSLSFSMKIVTAPQQQRDFQRQCFKPEKENETSSREDSNVTDTANGKKLKLLDFSMWYWYDGGKNWIGCIMDWKAPVLIWPAGRETSWQCLW